MGLHKPITFCCLRSGSIGLVCACGVDIDADIGIGTFGGGVFTATGAGGACCAEPSSARTIFVPHLWQNPEASGRLFPHLMQNIMISTPFFEDKGRLFYSQHFRISKSKTHGGHSIYI